MVEYEKKLMELKETNKILSMKQKTAPSTAAASKTMPTSFKDDKSLTEEEKLKKEIQKQEEKVLKLKQELQTG